MNNIRLSASYIEHNGQLKDRFLGTYFYECILFDYYPKCMNSMICIKWTALYYEIFKRLDNIDISCEKISLDTYVHGYSVGHESSKQFFVIRRI